MTPDVVIHGLGYVGLTAAVHFAKAGKQVLGFDPSLDVVTAVNGGRPRAGDFLAYLDVDVGELTRTGLFQATNDFQRAVGSGSQVHLIAVPTERAGKPDDSVVLSTLGQLLLGVESRTVLVESTLTPGTIDWFLARNPSVYSAIKSGRVHLAVCPRRDWFADPQKNLSTLPRVVGGVTTACTHRASDVLIVVSPMILRTDYRTAELTKAIENALFHIPVVFLHQLAYALPRHDVAQAIELVSTHWRFHSMGKLYLGFGTGGRCVPLGTEYLVEAAKRQDLGALTLGNEALMWDAKFRTLIADIVMMRRPAPRLVLVLGVAYRPRFRDAGRSAALDVVRSLRLDGVNVNVHDPMWTTVELQGMVHEGAGVESDLPESLAAYDVILLATPHPEYLDLPVNRALWRPGQLVLDGQGSWHCYRHLFHNYGVEYRRVGEPGWTGV